MYSICLFLITTTNSKIMPIAFLSSQISVNTIILYSPDKAILNHFMFLIEMVHQSRVGRSAKKKAKKKLARTFKDMKLKRIKCRFSKC